MANTLEVEMGDTIFMNASLMKALGKYKSHGKLSPRYFGPYQTVKRIGKVAYRIALPPEMANFHDVFYISILRKCRPDSEKIIAIEQDKVAENMSVDMIPVEIL